jgi:hypothetical protein
MEHAKELCTTETEFLPDSGAVSFALRGFGGTLVETAPSLA